MVSDVYIVHDGNGQYLLCVMSEDMETSIECVFVSIKAYLSKLLPLQLAFLDGDGECLEVVNLEANGTFTRQINAT